MQQLYKQYTENNRNSIDIEFSLSTQTWSRFKLPWLKSYKHLIYDVLAKKTINKVLKSLWKLDQENKEIKLVLCLLKYISDIIYDPMVYFYKYIYPSFSFLCIFIHSLLQHIQTNNTCSDSIPVYHQWNYNRQQIKIHQPHFQRQYQCLCLWYKTLILPIVYL